jgi:hypothetical protein
MSFITAACASSSSAASHSRRGLGRPPGVEIITICRLANVPVRRIAKSTGSPSSVPAAPLDADGG